MFLGPEYPTIAAEPAAAPPTRVGVAVPAGMPGGDPLVPDRAHVARRRKEWVERWDKETGA